MQEKVLEQLKIKYEYLDFDNAIVLTCFHNAVEEFKRENPTAFDNKNIAGLELEHYFLHYLVLEMQKGNREIYDAVSIGLEYINDFVVRRRKDLVSSFNKEQQKAFYDEAFKNTINVYYKKMSLTSALTQNLLQIYNVAKEGYKEVYGMKYNLRLKSIYEVFSEYDVDILKTVLKAFQKKEMSYRLLVKKYGKNLDGEGAISFLTYSDSSQLEGILLRIESWLIYAQYLHNNNDSLESIYQFFNTTSDEKLVHILANHQKEMNEEVEPFNSKNDIMEKYQISEQILSDSLAYVKNKNYRLLYKYTYGINCKKMNKESILDMLGISSKLYQIGLLIVQKQLPTLISKAKESLEEELSQDLDNTSESIKASLRNDGPKKQLISITNNISNILDASKEEKQDFEILQKKQPNNDSANEECLKKGVETELEKRKENLIVSDKKSFPDIPPVEENLIEEIEENEEIVDEIEEVIEEIEENISQADFLESNISYMDSLILKLYNASYTREEIKNILSIDDDTLIDSYINHLNLFDDINSILDFILIYHPNRIKDILQSNYYASFMENLTEKEQEIIYLKLLSKTNSTFTDEMISILTEIPLEEIQDYQIMTKDDSFNKLNEYLNRPLLKKEFKKIKESQK